VLMGHPLQVVPVVLVFKYLQHSEIQKLQSL
jgi:hypothetical protein